MDPGLLEGYYKDDLLDPLPIDTPLLLPWLDRHYTSQIALDEKTPDIPIDALDGHGSILEIPR
jgi:hypothetical protein